MCEGGINTGQMKHAMAMVEDQLALAQQWLEQLHHMADHGHRAASSAELAQVTVMLGQAREKIETAMAKLDVSTDDVTVERV
ncbi:MAG: hypothetical protein JXE06_08620 [Coriobacteriia bacterium]|nr:hypothetical protein [Coriobacteriia bacterium]MBN2822908.1 hypothetical protein [Coriobacteriia bacterium]